MNKKEAMQLLRPKSRKKLQGKLKAAVKQARKTGDATLRVRVVKKHK